MPPNTSIFLLGLAVGTSLLVIGLLLGYWLGRRAGLGGHGVDRQQFLSFLRNLSNWTSEFSGDVSRYQTQLTDLNERVGRGEAPSREEVVELLRQIMQANQLLQQRLDSAELKLESQTDRISSYLTEARTDGLTGLFNRRAFDKTIDELLADWHKQNQPFSLGLIDIDHFKSINDTYGHLAGDAVLKHIAGTLQSELHEAVCVARYGGEEFAVLTLAPLEELAKALDDLRETVGQVEVQHDDHILSVTLSAGASQIESDDSTGKLVRRADEALYAAKLAGRNRVYLHDGLLCRLVTEPTAAETPAMSVEPVSRLSPKETVEIASQQARVEERLRRIVEDETQRMVQR